MCECHPGTIIETPEAARCFFDALGPDRFDLILHPLLPDLEVTVRPWLRRFGPAVTHLHMQMRDDGRKIVRFERRPELFRAAMALLRSEGFRGSMTFEFTETTQVPGENIDELWENGLLDLNYLRKEGYDA